MQTIGLPLLRKHPASFIWSKKFSVLESKRNDNDIGDRLDKHEFQRIGKITHAVRMSALPESGRLNRQAISKLVRVTAAQARGHPKRSSSAPTSASSKLLCILNAILKSKIP